MATSASEPGGSSTFHLKPPTTNIARISLSNESSVTSNKKRCELSERPNVRLQVARTNQAKAKAERAGVSAQSSWKCKFPHSKKQTYICDENMIVVNHASSNLSARSPMLGNQHRQLREKEMKMRACPSRRIKRRSIKSSPSWPRVI